MADSDDVLHSANIIACVVGVALVGGLTLGTASTATAAALSFNHIRQRWMGRASPVATRLRTEFDKEARQRRVSNDQRNLLYQMLA